MKELSILETNNIPGGSVLGVMTFSTIGFWFGGLTGLCMGGLPAIPGAIIGLTVGAYLGMDSTPQIIIIKEYVSDKESPDLTTKN